MLKYPNKSHRKTIAIPNESTDLAELMGIIMGDGGINNDWQLVITLNSKADLEYSKYIYGLLKKLFCIEVAIRKRRNRNAIVLVCSSTNLIDFLVGKGAVRGNKIKQQIDIPSWIQNNSEYEKAFVRGLVDTDGCLYIHKHTIAGKIRNNLGFCFVSMSEALLNSVADILNKFEIIPHISKNHTQIYLYKQKIITKYLEIFKPSNPRITNKYTEWSDLKTINQF